MTATFGCDLSELRVRSPRLHDEAKLALVAFFRLLPVEQQRALLEIISSMGVAAPR